MKCATLFTALRGLAAAAVTVLLTCLILIMAPLIFLVLMVIFAICALRSDS